MQNKNGLIDGRLPIYMFHSKMFYFFVVNLALATVKQSNLRCLIKTTSDNKPSASSEARNQGHILNSLTLGTIL